MSKKTKEEYQQAVTTEAKAAEILAAASEAELDEMWGAWEERGWSKDGLTYAAVLERKAELGVELSEKDQETVRLAGVKVERAKRLPPITGKMADS